MKKNVVLLTLLCFSMYAAESIQYQQLNQEKLSQEQLLREQCYHYLRNWISPSLMYRLASEQHYFNLIKPENSKYAHHYKYASSNQQQTLNSPNSQNKPADNGKNASALYDMNEKQLLEFIKTQTYDHYPMAHDINNDYAEYPQVEIIKPQKISPKKSNYRRHKKK